MKIIKAELEIPKYVHVKQIDPERDSLYEDIKTTAGRKIVSRAKTLDSELHEKLKAERDVTRLWIKRSFPKWVISNQARKRNLTTLEMKEVDVEYGKAIKELAGLSNIQALKKFLENLRDHSSMNGLKTRVKNFMIHVDKLLPQVKEFRERLVSISDDKKRQEVIELLQRPPDKIGPVEFPKALNKFARKYMNYLCRLEELRFKAANIVFAAETTTLEKLTGQPTP